MKPRILITVICILSCLIGQAQTDRQSEHQDETVHRKCPAAQKTIQDGPGYRHTYGSPSAQHL